MFEWFWNLRSGIGSGWMCRIVTVPLKRKTADDEEEKVLGVIDF